MNPNPMFIICFFLLGRRDKYESHLKEYWVDVLTTGSFEDENEEMLVDKTAGEGLADSIDLGLQPIEPQAGCPGEEPDEVTDQELDGDGDETASSRKVKVPKREEVEQEHTLEVGPYMSYNTPFDSLNLLGSSQKNIFVFHLGGD